MTLSVNKKYFIDFFEKTFTNKCNKAHVLDFGCGSGDAVIEANRLGYKFIGVDNYFEGVSGQEFDQISNKENLIFLKKKSKLPFDNNYFDFIYSNQVFEHIKEIDEVLNELYRILKDDGIMIHVFPIRITFLEAHCGIPFIHWFNKHSKLRKYYLKFFFHIGAGYNKKRHFEDWYNANIRYVDNYCYYRDKKEILNRFKKLFMIKQNNKNKLIHRLFNKKGGIYKFLLYCVKISPDFIINFIEERRGSLELICKKI